MKKGVLAILGACILFSLIGVLTQHLAGFIPPLSLLPIRFTLGFLTLLMLCPFFDKDCMIVSKHDLKEYAIIGGLYAASTGLFTMAVATGPIQNAVLLNQIQPFAVIIFAYLILREQVTRTRIIALIIGLAGLAIINPLQTGNHIANILAMASGVTGGLRLALMRKEAKIHSASTMMWFMFFAAIVTLPLLSLDGFGNWQPVWLELLFFGTVGTAISHLLLNISFQELETEYVAITVMVITPTLSIILAALLLSESLLPQTLIGGAILVLAGVILQFKKENIEHHVHH
jgi:drug/metabolite transporter (DMT)-like permease